MTKAQYSPISDAAAAAFNQCVDGLVMRKLTVPDLSAVGASLASADAANVVANVTSPDKGQGR